MADSSSFRLADQEYDPAIPVGSVSEHPDNPNQGDTDLLGEMLDEFGFVGAIIVQRSTRYIVSGNHRHRAARAKGAATLPGFIVDLDDEQARKWMAGDNESVRRGRNDLGKLVALLRPMKDLRGSGYTAEKLNALTRQAQALGVAPADPNAEWTDMPSFDQPDKRGAYQARVHFPTQEDADRFFELIGRPKAKWFWWPHPDGHVGEIVSGDIVEVTDGA